MLMFQITVVLELTYKSYLTQKTSICIKPKLVFIILMFCFHNQNTINVAYLALLLMNHLNILHIFLLNKKIKCK